MRGCLLSEILHGRAFAAQALEDFFGMCGGILVRVILHEKFLQSCSNDGYTDGVVLIGSAAGGLEKLPPCSYRLVHGVVQTLFHGLDLALKIQAQGMKKKPCFCRPLVTSLFLAPVQMQAPTRKTVRLAQQCVVTHGSGTLGLPEALLPPPAEPTKWKRWRDGVQTWVAMRMSNLRSNA